MLPSLLRTGKEGVVNLLILILLFRLYTLLLQILNKIIISRISLFIL